ncbi:MAG: secretion protein HlyD [Marmoricola sp.]|nr:secretion protein HlyD [Marmoricola sp.]
MPSLSSSERNPGALLGRLRTVPRRWWAIGVVVVVLAAAGWIRFAPGSSSSTTQEITATIATGTYKTTVSATGTITPVRDTVLSFTSSGTVTRVAVKAGQKVLRGDVLAKIDATALRAQRDAAEAQLTAANSQLSEDSGGTTAQVSADEASVASATSALRQAQDAVANATLTAPFTGVVSAVSYAVGDTVGSSQGSDQNAASGGSTTTGVTVISPTKLLVDADVSSTDISQLKVGMQATITPTGGTTPVYGTVSEVGSIASASDTGAAQFPVVIAVTGSPTGLYPGASATVAITVKQATNVLTVPTQALHTSGTSTYVYTVKNGKKTRTTVTLGTAYGAQTEVLSGLKAGDVVSIITITLPAGGVTRNGGTGLFNRGGTGTTGGTGGAGGFPGGGNFTGGFGGAGQ